MQVRCASQRRSRLGRREGAGNKDALRMSGTIARVDSSAPIIKSLKHYAAKVSKLFVNRRSHELILLSVIIGDNCAIATVDTI
jgi:hypothetical protein